MLCAVQTQNKRQPLPHRAQSASVPLMLLAINPFGWPCAFSLEGERALERAEGGVGHAGLCKVHVGWKMGTGLTPRVGVVLGSGVAVSACAGTCAEERGVRISAHCGEWARSVYAGAGVGGRGLRISARWGVWSVHTGAHTWPGVAPAHAGNALGLATPT